MADWTTQPCGIVGRLNLTRARRLAPLFDITLRVESDPLLDEGLPESIHESAFAVSVVCGPQFTGGGATAWIVQVKPADDGSMLPAWSIARTSNVCWPTARPVYDFGEVQSANEPVSSLHWNVDWVSFEVNVNDAFVSVVVAGGCAVSVVFGAVVSAGAWIVHVYVAGV